MGNNQTFSALQAVIADIENHESITLYRDVGGIGDAVMIIGAITGLRRKFGNKIKIVMATIPFVSPVFYNNPMIDWIIDSSQFDKKVNGTVELGSGVDICRHIFEKAGSTFYTLSHPCPCSAYEVINEPLPTRNTNILKSRQELFAEACGVQFQRGDCKIFLTKEELAISKDTVKLDRYVTMHMQSSEKARNLPKSHVKTIGQLLSSRLGIGVVLLSNNPKLIHEKRQENGSIISIINAPLRQVINIIANSEMLIGIDSMGVHVAGALDIPVYGIFGPTDPEMRLDGYFNTTWHDGYNKCKRKPCWYHPCFLNCCMNAIKIPDLVDDIVWQYDMNKLIQNTEIKNKSQNMEIKSIENREVTERKEHKDDPIRLNYTGLFTNYGDTLEDGTKIDHGKLWEYLSRYRMLLKLANISDINGKCIINENSVKYDTALELGCDWGHCFEAIQSGFKKVYGVEVMQSAVDRGIGYGRNIKHGLMEIIPYENSFFDIVISNHVLEHSTNINKTIQEIKRVTKSNGWGLHTLPLDLDGSKLATGGFHCVNLSHQEFLSLFADNGFKIINSFYLWNHDKEDFTIITRKS